MSEFKGLIGLDGKINKYKCGDIEYSSYDIIEKLNQLKKDNEDLEQENKVFKEYIQLLEDAMDTYSEMKNNFDKENEQLKIEKIKYKKELRSEYSKQKQRILNLIDEKIEYYKKQPLLAVRISTNCEHYKSCLHNHEINVCNKAKENAYRELKMELE